MPAKPNKIIIQPVENGFFITVDDKHFVEVEPEAVGARVTEILGGRLHLTMNMKIETAPKSKRKRGRPKKTKTAGIIEAGEKPKRKRGRPRKNPEPTGAN